MSDLKAPYVASQERLHALLDGLSDDAFNTKPGETRWSAGECVVHLNKIAKGYLPKMEAAVAVPDAPRGEGPFHYGWLSRLFISSVTPGSRNLPTAGAMKPPEADGLRSDVDRQRAVGRFDADIGRYLAVIDAADGLDLARIKIASPFLSVLRLPLGAFLDAMGQHSLRHVLQAERAVAATGGAR
jgi:hypothetical protein